MTEQQKLDVLQKFYRIKLREGETIIDNSDKTIALEMGLSYGVVKHFLSDHSNIKMSQFADRLDFSEETEEKNSLFHEKVISLLSAELTDEQQNEILKTIELKIKSLKWKNQH